MAEYVEKSKVKEILKQYFKDAIDKGKLTLDAVDTHADLWAEIKMIPAAEVFEKVYCKDCVVMGANSFKEDGMAWCGSVGDWVKPDDWCEPERREGTDNGKEI